ncbi:MAG: adenylosuccinate lyase [Vampirovibrionales bacterium]
MIERYSRPEMTALWTQQAKYQTWLAVQLTVLEAQEALGHTPPGTTKTVRSKAAFDVDRIDALEVELKHDVIAFLTSVNEHVGDAGRYLHQGMTSSDMIDTALALQIRDAGRLMMTSLDTLIDTISRRADEHIGTVKMGRSHGIHAEPTTFGLTLLVWVDELQRCREHLQLALDHLAVGQMSGPVGTYSAIDPQVEEKACAILGLKPARISTQIIQRDRHAALFNAFGLLASVLEQCAIEIRHGQRTEVMELEEAFSKGQKGSSAMPHKRNPIASENLTGLARLVRSYALPAMENVALWHERDISHSSVERVIFPDAFIVLHYALHRFNGVMDTLVVNVDRMRANVGLKGHVAFSAAGAGCPDPSRDEPRRSLSVGTSPCP